MFIDSFKSIAHETVRRFSLAAVLGCALLAGCASNVTNTAQYGPRPQVRPDTIYVYAFDASSDQVKLDDRLMQKLKSQFSGESKEQQQGTLALQAREQVADEIVQKLQSMGLNAVRANTPAPADQNVLLVQGTFQTIDEGNRRRRVLIGLGAGKSQIGTAVQILYKPAGGAPTLIQTFDATADSGKAPGMAETAGVGAVAGHVAVSAAVGGGLHGVSETRQDGMAGNARKLAASIAKEVAQIGVSEGWVPAERVQ
jgi:hypothetical protein